MNPTQQDLENLRQQQADMLNGIYASQPEMAKGISTSIQPVGYNLSPLVACFEPMWEKFNIFVKKFPRVGPAQGQVGTKAQWWQINSVINGMSSSYEGGLGAVNTTSTTLIEKAYKTTALYDYVTYEAQAAGTGFMDAKGTSIVRALRKFRQKEEYKIIGGNITALTGPTAVTCVAGAAGTIAAGEYTVKVCPVTAEALQGIAVNQNLTAITLAPYLDEAGAATSGRYWGVGVVSATSSACTLSTDVGSIAVTITASTSAPAYAVFMKVSTDSNYTLQAVTTYNQITLTKYLTTGSIAPTVEGSNDSLSFDGIIPTIMAAGNPFGSDMGYAKFTADETGVTQINEALQKLFDTHKVAATDIYVTGRLRKTISEALINKGAVYNMVGIPELDNLTAGKLVTKYLHPATGEPINVHTHPYLPEGTCLILTENVDLPELGVSSLFEMHIAQDYFERDVMQSSRRYPFEIFTYSVLGMRAPQYCAVIKNIQPGLGS